MAQGFKFSYTNANGRVREWTLSLEAFWLLLVLAVVAAGIAFGPLYWIKPNDELPVVQKEPPDNLVPLFARDPSALVMTPTWWLRVPKTVAKRSR